MLLQERDYAIREEGRQEGREEGVLEEREESMIKTVKILRELNLSEKEILTRLTEAYPDNEDMIRKIMDKQAKQV